MRRWIETEDPGLIPTSDPSAQMASLLSAAMTFVAAVILALAMGAARTAATWETSVSAGLTVELPGETTADRQEAVIAALTGLSDAIDVRVFGEGEMVSLLSPWLPPDTEIKSLRLPILIAVEGDVDAATAQELVTGVAPLARVVDHSEWREPVLAAASRIRTVAYAALCLVAGTAIGVVWLAVSASVARGGRTVEVLRIVGATDGFVISRFARPFAVRAAVGSAAGAVAAIMALVLVRLAGAIGPVTAGPVGYQWLAILLIPLVLGGFAFVAARLAVSRALRSVG